MVSPQRRALSASPDSSSSGSSAASDSSQSSASTTVDAEVKNASPPMTTGPSTPRAWRFLDTEETCHFFNTEIVVGTNDVRQVDLDDASDASDSEDDDEIVDEPDTHEETPPTDTQEPTVRDLNDDSRVLDPMQTTYDNIFGEFDDLYLPGITKNAPRKMRTRRAAQRRDVAQVLSAFSTELQIGQSYLYRKRSEFLRVCFQRTLELNKDQDTQENAETARSASLTCPPRGQTVFRFQCSRLERPIDVSTPELHPRKWPHVPYRNPYEWKNDLAAIVTFAQRVNELPEGSLLYEPIDVHEFTEKCYELLRDEGLDIWSLESGRDTSPTETAIAILVAMLSVAVRLQSFSMLLLVAELLVREGQSSVLATYRWGKEMAAVVSDCMHTLQTFLHAQVPPATYPRALVSQWKICAYQPSTSDAIATDGFYLYIYGRSGLLKVGTGRGSTMRDFVYEHNKSYRRSRDAERSWLCLIDDYLYCRSIVMPSNRVDRINTTNLRAVDELVFAPSSKAPDHPSASSTVYAMVTDGTDLFTIHSIDTHAVSDTSTKKARSSRKKPSSGQAAKALATKATATHPPGAAVQASGGVQVGDRVIRGPDWKWGAQDGEKGSPGTVERISTWGGVKGCGVTVRWDKNQRINTYRWGAEGCYDIVVVVEKPGGVLEKQPLPDKSTASSTKAEPIAPRHHFVVARFRVSTLLCVVDLDREAASSFLCLRPKTAVAVQKRAAGNTELLLTAVHEHTLGVSSASTAWMCDGGTAGCLGDNSGVRYRCERGCDFDLCDVCLANTLIGKQSDPETPVDAPKPEASIPAGDDTPSEATPPDVQAIENRSIAPIPAEIEDDPQSTEEREAAQLDDLVTFWCGLYSRRECEIALQRADYSVEDATSWLNDCGHELRTHVILPCTNTYTLESPPNSSGLDPVLLVAGSFYVIDGQLCIVSPPGLYQGEKAKRSIHAADAAWFFSLKDGSLLFSKSSPVLLKSVPAGSPVCADLVRRRVLVFSGYLNCVEEYSVAKNVSESSAGVVSTDTEALDLIGERIYAFMHEASDQRWAWRAYKRPWQGLQEWINQLQQEGVSGAAAYIRDNVKTDVGAAKTRTRRIKKLRLRMEEFEKLGRSGDRGYFVPYCVDFSDWGLRGLLAALNRATNDLVTSKKDGLLRLRRVSGIWRGFLGDCIASDVVLQTPTEWSHEVQSAVNGLQQIVFGNIGDQKVDFFHDSAASQVVSACQDVLLWGIDVGLFEGFDRCDLLVVCLRDLLADSSKLLPLNYFDLMHDSLGEIQLQSSHDCSIAFVRRVLALNVEATDGGIAGLVYQRSQVEDLMTLLFKLSAREYDARIELPSVQAAVGSHAYTPVEKGLLAIFNGCAIDLLASADVVTACTSHRRRLSSLVAEESMFHVFATTCLQTCEALVTIANARDPEAGDAGLASSVCGKLLPLVLAMACNGGRGTLTGLKGSLLRLTSLVAASKTGSDTHEPSRFLPTTKTVESSHPYSRNQGAVRKVVRIPGATCLHIDFDPRCSTTGEADFVFVTPGHAWFHSDRVPFGENGIGDAGGCFFGSRQSGNWPQSGRGIAVWGDTATIMLCSTSQDRQGTSAEEETRRWGLKCVVRGVRLGRTASWRNDTLVAAEHALCTLAQRQMSQCDRTHDAPLLSKAEPLLKTLRGLEGATTGECRRLVREIITTTVEECKSNGASLIERYESTLLAKARSQNSGARCPSWKEALRLVLATVIASTKKSDEEIMSHDSLVFQSILRTVSRVEQWMVRRVQLLKEWCFLQDDNVPVTQLVERLSTDIVRLKELCVLKDVPFFESDPKRSATDLHGILAAERASGAPIRATDHREEVAQEVIEKAQYALECAAQTSQNSTRQGGPDDELSTSAILDYLTSTMSATEVRLADESLSGALHHAVDAFQLIQETKRRVDFPLTFSSTTTGTFGSSWNEHTAERLGLALWPDSAGSSDPVFSWDANEICQNLKDVNISYSLRVAAITDFLAAHAQFRSHISGSALQHFVAAVSDLLLDVERTIAETRPEDQVSDYSAVGELVWMGYRFGIDTMFVEGDHKGAVSALREMVGRLLSIPAGVCHTAPSLQWKSLARVMRIASAHVQSIAQSPVTAIAWVELCTAQILHRDFMTSVHVQVASLRTLFAMAQISSTAVKPSIAAVMLDHPELIAQLLERIGVLQSTVKFASDETENKLKDCGVVLLENEKSKLKIVDALDAVGSDNADSVCLPGTLSCLDLSDDPPHAPPMTSGETVESDAVHRNVRCDGCSQSPIRGFRFKCFTCANYDLCGACYANQSMHSLDHQFVRLARAAGAGELLQPRSTVNGSVVPEATLVGSKQWMGSVLRAALDAYGYSVLCRGSSEDCLRKAHALATAGFAVTVMEWPDVKDLEDFYDWNSVVQATLEPGSARLSRRASSASSSTASRKVDRSVVSQFNCKLRNTKRQHELRDARSLLAELIGFTRYLMNQDEVLVQTGPLVSEIVEALKGLGTQVSLSTVADRALFHQTLGLTNVLGGFVETLRRGARVKSSDPDASKHHVGIVKQFTDMSQRVSVMWCSPHGLSDDEPDLESMHSPLQLYIVPAVEVTTVPTEMSAAASFFPAFAAALKTAHKLLKRTPLELAQNEGHVAATELVVSWLRMFMASMEKLPSLLDSRASPGNGSGNMALLLFQLAKTSKSCGSFESLEASRSVLWHAQQVVLSDCQFKLASRPIATADVGQDASAIFGPGANGVTDLTEYVFNLYAHSSRSELPKHSGRNKLLEYWEKNVIPAIEAYVAGSFKSYEMDYFFAQLREPLREGNQAAAMKIAFTLCDGHVPSGCHYPDPDTDWSALQLDDIEIGARYVITDGLATSDQTDWPMEMRWTVSHSGVVRAVCPNGLVLMQLWNPRTACLEHWWFHVENLATCSAGVSFSERSVDNYESTLADLLKLDMELLGAIARKCVFSMLRHSPEQFPLVSDRQATKTHFNIVDILRMAAGAELGCEAKTLVGESEVGRSLMAVEDHVGTAKAYDLMESLRFVLSKRFEYVPATAEDATASDQKALSPVNQANKTKLAKSGKTPGGLIHSPQKSPQGLGVPSTFGLAVVKYRYMLIEALVQELKRALESSSSFSEQSAFTVVSDSPPNPLIMLKVPGASCLVISFAVHPVLMDLPAGSSLEFFRDERCTKRIFGFFGDKRGLNFLPPLIVEGDSCFVRASQASYARYKFRVDPLTSDFGLAMWIGNELYQRMMSVTLSGFELESIVSSALNSISDYLVNGLASLPPTTKGVVCQLLTKIVNFAINRSMSNSVPLSKLSVLTRDLAVAYDHELSAQKGLFSLPTQQLGELLATVEEVARLRGTTSIGLSTTWWPTLVKFATFTRALTYKRESGSSTDVLARVSSGRTPVEAIDEAARMLQDRDLLGERMILLQKLPQTNRLPELEAALCRFIQHLALEECGEADDQTVLSATEVVRFGVLGKVVHLPVDENGETIGYALVDVGRHDIIPRLLLRLQKAEFAFDGNLTEEDAELADKLNGQDESVPTVSESDGGDGIAPASDDTVWSCGVCTLENPASEVECAACGSPMPSDARNAVGRRQRIQSMRTRSASSQDHAAAGATTSGDLESSTGWHCEACTLVNPWATFECGACGTERDPSLEEPSDPSVGASGDPEGIEAEDAKTVLHSLWGYSFVDLLKGPATQNVRQVTSYLVEQFTKHGKELTGELAHLVERELAFASAQSSKDGGAFVPKVTQHCDIENPGALGYKQLCEKILGVTIREPIKVYECLRESGFDLSVEPNHYTSLEAARASQAKWTHAMDVQLVALARQIGSRIGVLSLMDLCPSHLCASHVSDGSAALLGLESRDLRLRFVLLRTLNKMALEVFPMVNLRNATDPNAFRTRVVAIRQLLFPAVKIRFFAETQDHANLAQSNLMDATVKRPVVTLDRRQISAARQPGEPLSLQDPKRSLFAATMAQLSQVKPSILRAKRPTGASDPFVAFIVVFAGENVVGEGGPYRQLFNDIATELLSQGNPLFIPTQNSVMKIGEYRDRFLPNPSSTTRAMLKIYEFVGALMGCCIRTGVRLNIRLAPIIWKMLVKQSLQMVDLEHIDFSVCESLKFLEAAATTESSEPASVPEIYFDSFTTALSDGSIVELKPGGSNMPVTSFNCKEYVSMVKAARFQECRPQVDAMLRGIGTIVPIHLLQLCTWVELQQWVCGSLAVDVDLLKRHTLYSSGMTPDKFPHLDMFWRVLSGFSEENKRRFINFAWGQDTLPADDAEFDRTHTRLLIKAPPITTANQDSLLPKADTCFFNIELPAYSSDDIMRDKLKLAITMCTSMDGDEQTGRMDLYFSTDGLDDDHME